MSGVVKRVWHNVLDVVVQKGYHQMSDRVRFLDPIEGRNCHRPLLLRRHHHSLSNDTVLRARVKGVPL